MSEESLPEFVALGHAGSEHYAGLETFPNPGVAHVELTSDELAAICPVTGQPDFYELELFSNVCRDALLGATHAVECQQRREFRVKAAV